MTHNTAISSSRRVLVITVGIPNEYAGASQVVYFQYIKRLICEGHEVLHLLIVDSVAPIDEQLERYRKSICVYGKIEVIPTRAANILRRKLWRYRLDTEAIRYELAQARTFSPEVILVFDIVAAWIALDIPTVPRLVWLGDLNFQTIWLHALYALREDPRTVIGLPVSWMAAQNWRRIYANVLRNADDVVVVSHSSIPEIARFGIRTRYEPYPWPSGETRSVASSKPLLPTFAFFGNLQGLGSRSAMHFLTAKVYPQLVQAWGTGGFKILTAGMGTLPDWFKKQIAGKPEFQTLGFVENLDELIGGCHAVLSPIDVPVGNRTRIVTALAKRALVIAHRNVSLGNPALVDEETCALAVDAQQFVAHMKRAVEDPQWVKAITDRGRRCYEEYFAPEVAAPRLVARLLDVTRDHVA